MLVIIPLHEVLYLSKISALSGTEINEGCINQELIF